MPTITCPNCNQIYEVEDDVLGEKVECAVCNTTFIAQENEHMQTSAHDCVGESTQEFNYKGKSFSEEDIIKLAIYQNLFLFYFVLYILLFLILLVKGNTSILFNLSITFLLLLFPAFLVLFVSLRHALKESVLGTTIAGVMFFVPICRLACCIASIVQSAKILSAASLNKANAIPSISRFKGLLKENELKGPKRIWRFTKAYTIFLLLLLIPALGYNATSYYLDKDSSKTSNRIVTTRNNYQNSIKKSNSKGDNSNSSFIEDNKDILIPAAIILGAALLAPDSNQTNNAFATQTSTAFPSAFSGSGNSRFGSTSTSTFGGTNSSSGVGVFGNTETFSFGSGTSGFGNSSGAFESTGTSSFGGTTTGMSDSFGAFPGSETTQPFGGTSTTTFRDSSGMPVGTAQTSDLMGNMTTSFRDFSGMPVGTAQTSTFGGTTTTSFRDSSGMPAGTAQTSTIGGMTTTTFRDSSGMPVGTAQTSTIGGMTTTTFRDSSGMPVGGAQSSTFGGTTNTTFSGGGSATTTPFK